MNKCIARTFKLDNDVVIKHYAVKKDVNEKVKDIKP